MTNVRLKHSVLKNSDHICIYCGELANTVDHKISFYNGGANSKRNNLVPCCRDCNQAKGHFYDFETFLRMSRRYGKLNSLHMRQTNKIRLYYMKVMWKNVEHHPIRFYRRTKQKFPDRYKILLKKFINKERKTSHAFNYQTISRNDDAARNI